MLSCVTTRCPLSSTAHWSDSEPILISPSQTARGRGRRVFGCFQRIHPSLHWLRVDKHGLSPESQRRL
jgi:hypothetical protein